MSKTEQSNDFKNFIHLRITNAQNEVLSVLDITPRECWLMKDLITDIYENECNGITIILTLKSKMV
jgi:hypothetical protein